MTDLFIKVKIHQEQQLPFVLFAKPNSDKMVGLFQKNDHLYFLEDFAMKGFVFAPFEADLIPYIPQKESDVYVESIVQADYFMVNTTSPEIDETAKIVFENFNTVIKKVIALLKEEGFGVLTEIDIQQTLKKKLNVDFKKYKIFIFIQSKYYKHQIHERFDQL